MELIPAQHFLDWARAMGIVPDPAYSPPKRLVYETGAAEERWWDVPGQPQDVGPFVGHLLSGIGPWAFCSVWPRGGIWSNIVPPSNRLEAVRELIAMGPPIPDGFEGAVKYGAEEREQMVGRITAQILKGYCVYDDLFIIPDTGQCIVHADHHDVVHVATFDANRMVNLIAHMQSGGYALPDELLDCTFKRPGWMK